MCGRFLGLASGWAAASAPPGAPVVLSRSWFRRFVACGRPSALPGCRVAVSLLRSSLRMIDGGKCHSLESHVDGTSESGPRIWQGVALPAAPPHGARTQTCFMCWIVSFAIGVCVAVRRTPRRIPCRPVRCPSSRSAGTKTISAVTGSEETRRCLRALQEVVKAATQAAQTRLRQPAICRG